MDERESFVKEQLKILFNELEKIYIVEVNRDSCKKAIEQVEKLNFEELIEYLKTNLFKFEKDINEVIFTNGKLKSKSLNFLKGLILFGVDFKSFHHENKNTKKTIVKYLYNIFLIVKMCSLGQGQDDFSLENLAELKLPNLENLGINSKSIENLIKNKDLMKLAEDVSKDIEKENINPMEIMNGIMSGNLLQNKKLNGLLGNISKKLENKIKNGEINLTELESELKNFKM